MSTWIKKTQGDMVRDRLASDHVGAVDEAINLAQHVSGDRLHLLGLRDNVPRVLSAIDIFHVPSWREGMPRTSIEGMMMGRPVIATDSHGSREEVVQGVTGLQVPVRNPTALSEAMAELIGVRESQGDGKELGGQWP